ncbi:MAG: type II restriction endonuclease [Chloroflexi bacterium]|nr:type II restriction endonuclease [Chloroflexota bacterium]
MPRPYQNHLSSITDLVTPYEATRAGFVALALEKNRRATPTVEEARALKAAASLAPAPASLASMSHIRAALITAAGISEKAARYLTEDDKTEAIRGLVENFLEPAGRAFVEELVYRFLLTRGDALGGSMRNVGGELAQRKLTRAVIAALTLSNAGYSWLPKTGTTWLPPSADDSDIEIHAKGLSWSKSGAHRTLLYNFRVPLVGKNIDSCLLNCPPSDAGVAANTPEAYIAFGELKGGIDPAGADEHWKTARTAFVRIRSAFSAQGVYPLTFFLGAAIATAMANEIWSQLEGGALSNAANLTNANQLASLCNWLITI